MTGPDIAWPPTQAEPEGTNKLDLKATRVEGVCCFSGCEGREKAHERVEVTFAVLVGL